MTSREAAEMVAHHRAEWIRQIESVVGETETAETIVRLAELNGLFDPVKAAARPDAGYAVKALEGLLVDDDSEEADDECELCGGRGTIDAYTSRTEGDMQQGRDEIGCPGCIERAHSRAIRSALLEQPATPGYAAGFEACREAIAKLAREHRDWARSEKRDRECDEYFIAVGHESAAQDMPGIRTALANAQGTKSEGSPGCDFSGTSRSNCEPERGPSDPTPPDREVVLPPDVVSLVVAARRAFDRHNHPDDQTMRDLDKALEAFSSDVRYDDEPDALTSGGR